MPGRKKCQPCSEDDKADAGTFIEDADLLRLFDYWRQNRRGRLMPCLGDIDPLDIGWALSRIYLLDYKPGDGFVYRLAGDNVASVFGRANLKGLRPRDFLPPDRAGPVEKLYLRVVEDRCIMWMKGLIYLRADRTPIGERLFLPLGGGTNDDSVTGILGMTVVHSDLPEDPHGKGCAEEYFLPIEGLP